MHADRGELASRGPDAGVRRIALAGDPVRAHRSDEGFLELPQIPVEILLVSA
jgi:hypothetical protein